MDAIETEKIVTTAEMFEIVGNELKEKNAEIERLREALRSIASNTCCDRCQEAALVARAALKEKE